MEEIAEWFRRDLQRLLDMYKDKLSVPTIMHITKDVCHKTLSIRDNPGKFIAHIPVTVKWSSELCSQGPDGCCATYKNGWDACKGCPMYHGGK